MVDVVQAGDDQDRQIAQVAGAGQDPPAVQLGHQQVQQHQVGPFREHQPQRLTAVGGRHHPVPARVRSSRSASTEAGSSSTIRSLGIVHRHARPSSEGPGPYAAHDPPASSPVNQQRPSAAVASGRGGRRGRGGGDGRGAPPGARDTSPGQGDTSPGRTSPVRAGTRRSRTVPPGPTVPTFRLSALVTAVSRAGTSLPARDPSTGTRPVQQNSSTPPGSLRHHPAPPFCFRLRRAARFRCAAAGACPGRVLP